MELLSAPFLKHYSNCTLSCTTLHMHKVIINSFKLRGLVLQLDALEVLQELCQQQPNATEFIDKILNSIDSQKRT